jgi:hypothetical protein
LQEENQEASMLLLQFPPTIPTVNRSATADGPEVTDSSRPPGSRPPGVAHTVKKTCALDELPAGFMGKMLVYKSGAIKLKLGDTLYDVSRSYNKTKNAEWEVIVLLFMHQLHKICNSLPMHIIIKIIVKTFVLLIKNETTCQLHTTCYIT